MQRVLRKETAGRSISLPIFMLKREPSRKGRLVPFLNVYCGMPRTSSPTIGLRLFSYIINNNSLLTLPDNPQSPRDSSLQKEPITASYQTSPSPHRKGGGVCVHAVNNSALQAMWGRCRGSGAGCRAFALSPRRNSSSECRLFRLVRGVRASRERSAYSRRNESQGRILKARRGIRRPR